MLPFPNVGYVSCLEGITHFVKSTESEAQLLQHFSNFSQKVVDDLRPESHHVGEEENGQLEMGLEKGTCYTSPLSMLESFLLKE